MALHIMIGEDALLGDASVGQDTKSLCNARKCVKSPRSDDHSRAVGLRISLLSRNIFASALFFLVIVLFLSIFIQLRSD